MNAPEPAEGSEAPAIATPSSVALAGVLGWPVRHSRSPVMHNAAFAALGLPWRYLALPVRAELFAETARALPLSGYRGANVTLPHKEAALRLADVAGSAARAAGAANTLTFTGDGAIEADNTDVGGFLDALGTPPRGLRALILGAGGSARAVAVGLRDAGAADVAVWNRSAERAAALAEGLGVRHARDPRRELDDAALLVNATSVGLQDDPGGEAALEMLGLAGAQAPETVVDLVYGVEPTPVVRWASLAGARVVDGLEVLVRQGARSFEIWTGRPPPVGVMRDAARDSLRRPSGAPEP